MLCLYVNSSLVKYETGTVFMGSDLDRIRFFPEQIHCNSSTYTSIFKVRYMLDAMQCIVVKAMLECNLKLLICSVLSF